MKFSKEFQQQIKHFKNKQTNNNNQKKYTQANSGWTILNDPVSGEKKKNKK